MDTKIPIPKVNEYPFDKARAKFINEDLLINTADYCEQMTFGEYRLTGPSSGRDKSPLETVLECLRPYIIKAKWGQFKPKFTKQLKRAFTYICTSDYEPTSVKEMNDWINTGRLDAPAPIHHLLAEFALHGEPVQGEPVKGFVPHLDFVLHPETAEYYSSPAMLAIRSRIWGYAGITLDLNKYNQPPRPGSPRQMEMYLSLEIRGT